MFNYYNDFDYEMSVWEVSAELEMYAKREAKLSKKTGVISTTAGWRSDSYGSGYCAETSFDAIFDAYNDYRATKVASGMYSDDKYCY